MESKPTRRAIIDTEFISIMNAKENIIYSAAMLVVDEQGNQIYEKKWDLTYSLKEYAPQTYKYGLALAKTPKYRPARGEVKTKYRRRNVKQLGCLQLLIRRLQKNLSSISIPRDPLKQTFYFLINAEPPKFAIILKKIPNVSNMKAYIIL